MLPRVIKNFARVSKRLEAGIFLAAIADDQRRPNFTISPISADTMLSAASAHNDRSFHYPQGVIDECSQLV